MSSSRTARVEATVKAKVARQRFLISVKALEAEIQTILNDEVASGALRYYNDGVTFKAGGSWNSYVWKANDTAKMLDIQCRLPEDAPWYVEVFATEEVVPTVLIDWPAPDFRQRLTGALATIGS